MPRAITNRMISTLMVVTTMLNRDESFVPSVSSTASTTTSSSEPQSKLRPPRSRVVATPSPKIETRNSSRYTDQPLATAAAATENSSTRSQPMIHARNSPNVAYENV